MHEAIDALERQEFLRGLNGDYQRLRHDPARWEQYLAERGLAEEVLRRFRMPLHTRSPCASASTVGVPTLTVASPITVQRVTRPRVSFWRTEVLITQHGQKVALIRRSPTAAAPRLG